MRLGSITPQMAQIINRLDRPLQYTDGIEATDLFPRRDEANAVNTRRLDEITAPPFEYRATDRRGLDPDGYPIPDQIYEKLISRIMAPPTITLKVRELVPLISGELGRSDHCIYQAGAQVMLIKVCCEGVAVRGQ